MTVEGTATDYNASYSRRFAGGGLLGWWRGDRIRKRMSMDKFEDIAVLAGMLVFSSLSLAVIVLIY